MTRSRSVEAEPTRSRLVAVIASLPDLAHALRLRCVPDFFELRLDALYHSLGSIEEALPALAAPLIITARHPREGGWNALAPAQRRQLLLKFLRHAALIDVELRSRLELRAVLEAAKARHVLRIISVHDLTKTPSVRRLQQLARGAEAAGADIIKIVTRTDRAEELARLLKFFEMNKGSRPLSAAGIGQLGRASRRELARRGSVLNYAYLGTAASDGQLSIGELRRTQLHPEKTCRESLSS
ncbi:MAG: type I 3-dehydroquinate dehydratase [Chthoniobacterales bacterium]